MQEKISFSVFMNVYHAATNCAIPARIIFVPTNPSGHGSTHKKAGVSSSDNLPLGLPVNL